MMSETIVQARLEQVARHVELENLHDLDAVMGTFGPEASYDDEPWDEHPRGRDAVRRYYEDLLRAVPTCTSKCSAVMSRATPWCWSARSPARTAARGTASPRPVGRSSSRSAASIRSRRRL